jgi:hypothetical protein
MVIFVILGGYDDESRTNSNFKYYQRNGDSFFLSSKENETHFELLAYSSSAKKHLS